MTSKKRWIKAQQHEKLHWQKTANKIIQGKIDQLSWYDWKAQQFETMISKLNLLPCKDDYTILEVGSGPIGIVSFVKWGNRYAIEPLEMFFSKNQTLIQLRNNNVKYLSGQGEFLPLKNEEFSIVIIDNVIDHTFTPQNVLNEIYRVLKKNGLMFFTVNIRSVWGTALHSVITKLHIDKCHPHSFSYKGIRKFLNSFQFSILCEEVEDYSEVKKKNCMSNSLKYKLKGYSGLSEILYTAIYQKE